MNPNIITYTATLVAGILFIIFRQGTNVLEATNRIVALIFILPGIINFIAGLRNNRRSGKGWTTTFGLMLVSAGAVALGVLMLFFPEFFLPYVAFSLGVVLVLCGAYQLIAVLKGSSKAAERWFVAVPLLTMGAGVAVMVLGDKGMDATWWIVVGSALLAYSLNGFIAMMMLKGRRDDDRTVIVR